MKPQSVRLSVEGYVRKHNCVPIDTACNGLQAIENGTVFTVLYHRVQVPLVSDLITNTCPGYPQVYEVVQSNADVVDALDSGTTLTPNLSIISFISSLDFTH